MARLGYIDKIQDPTSNSDYYEIVDSVAREQLAFKTEKKYENSLPAKPTSKETWDEVKKYIYFIPIDGATGDDIYEEWTLFFIGDPDDASDYTDPDNYRYEKIGTTATDISNFSTKGHTHEVITEVEVEDHNYTPQGTVDSTFTGNENTTDTYTHNHSYKPEGQVSSTFTGSPSTTTESSTTGVSLNKSSKKLSTKKLKLESASVSLSPSTTTVAKNTFAANSGSYEADKSIFNGISVTDGVLSFVTKKLDTATSVTGMTGSTTATKVTFGGNATTEEDVATGAVESGSQLLGNDTGITDSGHTHTVTPLGSVSSTFTGSDLTTNNDSHSHTVTPTGTVNSSFNGLRANLKHKVDNKKVRTSPDQEDEGSHAFEWYGIEFDENGSDPIKLRIGNMDMHRMLPIQTKMRRCLLKDDGTVYNYLDPENSLYYAQGSKDANGNDISGRIAEIAGTAYSTYSDNTSTAFAVQVMVEIPEHWRRVRTYLDGANTMVDAAVSPYPQETSGWIHVKKGYLSAYEASIIAGKLCSVSNIVNLTLAIQNGKIVATCDVSSATGQSDITSQLPTTNVTMDALRTAARARALDGGAEWNQLVYEQYLAVVWLNWIEYANLNSQAAFTNAKTVEGFMQGGLGNGVSTISNSNWNSFNGYRPFVPCGITNCLGNHSGEVYLTLPSGLGGGTVAVPSYRGIENFFGHIWKFADGIKYLGDGSKQSVLRCNNPADYSSASASTGYTSIGDNYGGDGWKTKIMIGDDGDINCKAVGGSSNLAYCDYNYQAHTNGTYYCCLLGGDARVGAFAGVARVDSSTGVSLSYPNFGSRLCYFEK